MTEEQYLVVTLTPENKIKISSFGIDPYLAVPTLLEAAIGVNKDQSTRKPEEMIFLFEKMIDDNYNTK